jgi:hypothetical protein
MSEASANAAPAALTTTTRDQTRNLSAGSWALVGLFGIIFSLAISPAVDPDLGWHLGAGRWIWEHKHVPLSDPFSWSVPGRKWIAHEWLTEVLMYGVRSVGGRQGDGLLIFVWALIITTAWALLYRTARIAGASSRAAAIATALGAVSSINTWGVRPQMLTLLFVVFTGMRLQTWRTHGARTPWELVGLTALWVNLHGGYIFGVVMVLIFACGATGERVLRRSPIGAHNPDALRLGQIWMLFVGCVGASLVSPNGLDGLIYPFTYLGDNASTRYVGEWFAPNFANPQYWPFGLLLVAAAIVVVVGFRRNVVGVTELGLTLPFGYLGVQSVRNIAQFAVCTVPVVAAGLTALRKSRFASATSTRTPRPKSEQEVRQLAIAVAISSTLVVVSLVFMTRTDFTSAGNEAARAAQFPVRATEWLEANPGGTVFNYYDYGGWLVLHKVPVFVDGRPDMYGDAFMENYVRVSGKAAASDWEREMQQLSATRVLMPKNSSLAKAIALSIESGQTTDWVEPITDPVARLFVKRT